MNEQNNSIEQALFQRAIFAALLSNIISEERELSHDQIKFIICNAVGKMLGDDYVVHDEIEMALVMFCNNHAKEHNAMVEVNKILRGDEI